jgi:hypothetical protein
MKSYSLNPEELEQIKVLQEKKNQDLIKRFIIDQTESKVKNRFSDKELDAENEKRKILETIEDLWKIKNIGTQVLKKPADYESIFTQEYYIEMFRLNNWNYQGVIAEKPWQAGRYTNEIIYYRFSQEVLPFLRIVNPFVIPGFRRYKHHQYLTPGARNELSKFISQATEMMREFSDWDSFRIEYCKRYNVPYQLKLKL